MKISFSSIVLFFMFCSTSGQHTEISKSTDAIDTYEVEDVLIKARDGCNQ